MCCFRNASTSLEKPVRVIKAIIIILDKLFPEDNLSARPVQFFSLTEGHHASHTNTTNKQA